MTEDSNKDREADGVVDSIAATAILTVVVYGMYLWLSGMPS